MARKITIERREKLAGSGIDFFVVLNLTRSEFEQKVGIRAFGAKSQFLRESKQVFPLANGETITIKTTGGSNSFFIVAFPSDGSIFSQRIFVDVRESDVRYTVTLKLGLFRNQFVFDKL